MPKEPHTFGEFWVPFRPDQDLLFLAILAYLANLRVSFYARAGSWKTPILMYYIVHVLHCTLELLIGVLCYGQKGYFWPKTEANWEKLT